MYSVENTPTPEPYEYAEEVRVEYRQDLKDPECSYCQTGVCIQRVEHSGKCMAVTHGCQESVSN